MVYDWWDWYDSFGGGTKRSEAGGIWAIPGWGLGLRRRGLFVVELFVEKLLQFGTIQFRPIGELP